MKTEEHIHTVRIAPSTFLWAIGIVGGLFVLFQVQQILITLFFALIVMSALRPSMTWLEKKFRLPRIVAILFLYLVIIFAIVLAFAVIIPPLVRDIPTFVQTLSLPQFQLPTGLPELQMSLNQWSSVLPQLGTSFGAIYGILSSTFTGVFTSITVLVIASYLLLEREELHLKAHWMTHDERHIQSAKKLIDQIEVQLGGWVRGQLLLMIVIGLASFIGLSLLRIQYALPLALTAGLLEVLPNLGPMISAVPAIAVGYMVGGPAMAIFIALYYTLVQQAENNFIVPRIMKANVDVNPLTTIVVILVGLRLAGVIGALLAIPIYIVVRSVYAMWYREYYKMEI